MVQGTTLLPFDVHLVFPYVLVAIERWSDGIGPEERQRFIVIAGFSKVSGLMTRLLQHQRQLQWVSSSVRRRSDVVRLLPSSVGYNSGSLLRATEVLFKESLSQRNT